MHLIVVEIKFFSLDQMLDQLNARKVAKNKGLVMIKVVLHLGQIQGGK